jgi:hypothetical protein
VRSAASTGGSLEWTLAFLLFISIIPWPTALAATYADQGIPEARASAVLYAGTMLMMGLTFAWGWRYLAARTQLGQRQLRRERGIDSPPATAGPVFYDDDCCADARLPPPGVGPILFIGRRLAWSCR